MADQSEMQKQLFYESRPESCEKDGGERRPGAKSGAVSIDNWPIATPPLALRLTTCTTHRLPGFAGAGKRKSSPSFHLCERTQTGQAQTRLRRLWGNRRYEPSTSGIYRPTLTSSSSSKTLAITIPIREESYNPSRAGSFYSAITREAKYLSLRLPTPLSSRPVTTTSPITESLIGPTGRQPNLEIPQRLPQREGSLLFLDNPTIIITLLIPDYLHDAVTTTLLPLQLPRCIPTPRPLHPRLDSTPTTE